MTIYLDIVFLENILMNYIILFTVNTIMKIKTKQIRLVLSSILGSVYAVLILMSNHPIYTTLAGKVLLSICMIYIAFRSKEFKGIT